ncbi:MAG: hypothetical protein M3Z85_04225 [Acidobacteriota bacterium]|nr:hypothetical protein [Acidobacteriota bacterium]
MNRLLAIALAAAAVSFAGSASLPAGAEIDGILQELSAITGFPVRHKVAFESITREQVNRFLQERIEEVVKPAELKAEELTLKKFGFVPADFDLKQTTVALLTEQAAAFYDFHRKKLFITDWAPSEMRNVALVHELAHALADQNYSLDKYTRKAQKDSEKSLARQAVVEGQASWLTSEVMARRIGKSLGPQQAAREIPGSASDSSNGQYPVFDRAPLYLRETLLFPYTQGMQFQQAVYDHMGKPAFADVFRHPPVSTQQILHPGVYFENVRPATVKLPHGPKASHGIVEGSMGELDHSILLRQFIGKETADDLSPHWKGADYRLFENKSDKRVQLLYGSEWSNAEIAGRYFKLYEQILAHKWRTMEVTSRTASRIAGRGDDGYFLLRLDGTRVSSAEGWSDPESFTGVR